MHGYAGEWALTAKLADNNSGSPAGGLAGGTFQLKHLAMWTG